MISIVIITWNSRDDVLRCLESISEYFDSSLEFETIVVDNGSRDGTGEALKEAQSLASKIGLKVMYNSENLGLSHATEQAYATAKGDWILLCNPDITFNSSIIKLFDYGLSHVDAMVTGEMVGADGLPQRVIHRRFPTVTRVFFGFGYAGAFIDRTVMKSIVGNNYTYQNEHFPEVVEIEQPGASLLFLSRMTIKKIGTIFDLRFPVWWNDVDLAKRAKLVGVRRVLLSEVKIEHGFGHSTRQVPDNKRRHLFCTSMLLYARKWNMRPKTLQLLFLADAIIGVPLYILARVRTRGLKGVKNAVEFAAAQSRGVIFA